MSNKEQVVGKLGVEVDTSAIDRAIERVQLLMTGVLQLNESIGQLGPRLADAQPIAGAELVAIEDPTPAKLDELITEQKRTNELLAALLENAVNEAAIRLEET